MDYNTKYGITLSQEVVKIKLKLILYDLIKTFKETNLNIKLLILSVPILFLSYPITAVFLVFMFFYSFTDKKTIINVVKSPGFIFFALFALIAIISPVINKNWLGLIAGIAALMITLIGLYYRTVMTEPLFNLILDISCLCSIVCSLIAIVQKLSSLNLVEVYRPVSTFMNANYFGCISEFMIIICIYKLIYNNDRSGISFYGIALLANLISLYLSGSYSSVLGIVTGIFILLLYAKKYKKIIAVSIVFISIAAILVLFPVLMPRITSDVETTASLRLTIWNEALRAFLNHPLFGQGLLSYFKVSREMGVYVQPHSHSIYIDVLLNFGIIGTLMIISYTFILLKNTYFEIKRSGRLPNIGLALAIASAVMTHGISDVTILWMQTSAFFIVLFSGIDIKKQIDCD